MESKIIISVEGNIGAGKSTFIDILKKKWDDCEVVSEPIEMWKDLKDSNGENILQIFYKDIKRWAYSFQNVACITRMIKIENIIKNSPHKFIFLDRSLGTDKNVFEKMLFDSGDINAVEHSMYNLWSDFYYEHVRPHENSMYIYLKCSPETSNERIKKRGRIEEESISLEYLKRLDKYHDDWLLNINSDNLIVLNCDEEFENNEDLQNNMIEQIKEKLNLIGINNLNNSIKEKLILEKDTDAVIFNKI